MWLLYVVHYTTASLFNTAKKPMPRKMIINQCSCPDSILLLFSCIHKFYETNIYKKNAIQMSLAYETGVQGY